MGSGGQAGAGDAGTGGAAAADESVLEKGKRPSKDGNYIQPKFTTAAAAKVMPDTAFNASASFTGKMYSSPLYLANGPGGNGIFIAATTNNDVKAFDDTGKPAWTRSFGTLPGGGPFPPTGIMSTPVIDPTAGPDGFATIYACAPAGATAGGSFNHYELHAISAKDGSERAGWPAKLDGTVMAKNDGLNRAFTPTAEGQRPALSLVNGIVYVGFGGPFGDIGMYYGWVIAVDTMSPATIGAWSTRLPGGAIWSPGGFASDGNGVIITTGNYWPGSFTAPMMYGDTESIIRLTGMPSALTRSDAYYPARWRDLDTNDQDFGASSVMLLNVPGATPANYGVSASKDAHLYFVNSTMLGTAGGGGEIIDLTLSPSNHSMRTSPVSYTTASGIHVALTVDRGPYMGCPASSTADPGMAVLMGFTVTPGNPIKVTQNWCTTIGGPSQNDQGTVKNRSGSPLVTTTDGKANPIVWVAGSMSQTASGTTANLLYGVDGETGAVLYKGGNCTGIRQWTTPIAVKGHIVVGGDGKLCSWSPQ
ncbi:MAG TPA: hypothetical protein VH374_23280 [Polyangia bacterium]|jgi:hypothetical protein|nr:hypothetical protein [Polyangia bacterium]